MTISIFAEKDTTLYKDIPTLNSGLDEILEIRSSNYKIGDGFDGDDVFRDADLYWYIEPNMNYNDVVGIISKKPQYF